MLGQGICARPAPRIIPGQIVIAALASGAAQHVTFAHRTIQARPVIFVSMAGAVMLVMCALRTGAAAIATLRP